MTYDCTAEVKLHIEKVRYHLRDFAQHCLDRAQNHDASKLQAPEKQMFDVFTPKLKELEFGSDEYKQALLDMGEALRHHYKSNRHHPEHYENGINGMALIDIVEMVCDWMAAADKKGTAIDLDYLADRFGIDGQMLQIIENTLRDIDFWYEVNGVPVVYFSKRGPLAIE